MFFQKYVLVLRKIETLKNTSTEEKSKKKFRNI